jgi:hypothetical protein
MSYDNERNILVFLIILPHTVIFNPDFNAEFNLSNQFKTNWFH